MARAQAGMRGTPTCAPAVARMRRDKQRRQRKSGAGFDWTRTCSLPCGETGKNYRLVCVRISTRREVECGSTDAWSRFPTAIARTGFLESGIIGEKSALPAPIPDPEPSSRHHDRSCIRTARRRHLGAGRHPFSPSRDPFPAGEFQGRFRQGIPGRDRLLRTAARPPRAEVCERILLQQEDHRRRAGERQGAAAATRFQAHVQVASRGPPPAEHRGHGAAGKTLAPAYRALGHGAEAGVDEEPSASAIPRPRLDVGCGTRGARCGVFREFQGHDVPAPHLHRYMRRGDRRLHGMRAGVDGTAGRGDYAGAERKHAHLVGCDG